MKRESVMGAVADRWPRVGPRAERAIGYLVARHALRGCDVGAGVSVTGRLRVARRGGRIVVGRDALFVGGIEPTCLIAANATIGLMEPISNGVGGDIFAIVWDAKTKKLYGLNGSGRSPKSTWSC